MSDKGGQSHDNSKSNAGKSGKPARPVNTKKLTLSNDSARKVKRINSKNFTESDRSKDGK